MPIPSHQTVRLARGRHAAVTESGVCVMELASVLAGEPLSDHPRSVSPVLAAFLRGYNDTVGDARRQALKPFAATAVGTAGGGRRDEDERRRLIAAAAGGRIDRLHARFWVREGATLDESGCQHLGRRIGHRVASRDDDARHAAVLGMLGELTEVGRRAPRAVRIAEELLKTAGPSGGDRRNHEHHARRVRRTAN